MAKISFLEGMGLGLLAGATLAVAAAAKRPDAMREVRHAARRAACKVDHLKNEIADSMDL